MKTLPLLLALLLIAPPPARADLRIAGDLKVRPHRMAVLSAEGAPDGAALIWDFDEDRLHGEEAGGRLFLAGPPGSYRVKLRAIIVKDGRTQALTARAEVVIGDPAPPPPKAPDKPAPKADPLAALCRLRVGTIGCTATVVGPRRPDGRWDVLTASHCMGTAGRKGTITLKDGRTLAVTAYEREAASDLCWMATDDPVDSLPFALLAAKAPEAGTAIWHAGFGVDRPGNTERGTITAGETPSRQLVMSLSVSHGDSGGGIFREDTGELVAAVCCTRSVGVRTQMYGGSSVRAAELRAKPACLTFPFLDLGREAWADELTHPFLDLEKWTWTSRPSRP